MPVPRFQWISYNVDVPHDHALAHAMKANAAPAAATMPIQLPDLGAYDTPKKKADALLRVAAEVEHALLVQYLYSAYSLKLPGDVTDQDQKAALGAWRGTIVEIAREEMGHLMTVQNFRVVLDLLPTLERSEFPMLDDLFPFDFHLGPLTKEVLADYIVAESKPNDPNDPSTTTVINHVGVLYGLIGVVFASGPDEIKDDASGNDPWYEMVAMIAEAAYQQDPNPARWHLDQGDFDASTLPKQANAAQWQMGVGGQPPPQSEYRLWHFQDRAGAKTALRDLGLQGEGPAQGPSSGEKSHFERFNSIYQGEGTTIAFPADGAWTPANAVPMDPVISNDGTNANAITNPEAQLYAALGNARYALILGLIGHYLVADSDERAAVATQAIKEMTSLRGLSSKLVGMDRAPQGATTQGKAALPFNLPALLHPIKNPTVNRAVVMDRLQTAITLGTLVVSTYGDKSQNFTINSEQILLQLLQQKAANSTSSTEN